MHVSADGRSAQYPDDLPAWARRDPNVLCMMYIVWQLAMLDWPRQQNGTDEAIRQFSVSEDWLLVQRSTGVARQGFATGRRLSVDMASCG